jgi:mono/diheme cytochrome c family protein
MRKISIPAILILLTIAVFIANGCSRKQDAAQEPPQISTSQGPATVSLTRDVMPLFTRSCAVCHKREGGNPAAVAEKTYFEKKEDILGKVGKLIRPGKPGESRLLNILNQSYPVGRRKIVMPPPGMPVPRWSPEEVDLFSRWIMQGALDS